jgi:hypothetical protein
MSWLGGWIGNHFCELKENEASAKSLNGFGRARDAFRTQAVLCRPGENSK